MDTCIKVCHWQRQREAPAITHSTAARAILKAVGAWSIIDPIYAAWQSPAAPPLEPYPVGQWGPLGSNEWMESQGHKWFDVCPVLR